LRCGHHERPTSVGSHDQHLDRELPYTEVLFGFGKLLDLFGGVREGDELATVRQRSRHREFEIRSSSHLLKPVNSLDPTLSVASTKPKAVPTIVNPKLSPCAATGDGEPADLNSAGAFFCLASLKASCELSSRSAATSV